MAKIILIVAYDLEYGIGNKGDLIYHLTDDLKRFKTLTIGHTVVMGRKTWESLPKKLPKRTNVVLSSTPQEGADMTVTNVEEVLALEGVVYIIGGASLYRQFLPHAHSLEITHIQDIRESDTKVTFFATELDNFDLIEKRVLADADKKSGQLVVTQFKTYSRK